MSGDANCPFYGFSIFRPDTNQGFAFVLISTRGNQCALMHNRHAPCHMEMSHLPVEWSACPYVKEVRLGG